jgi:hypothetical protein
VNIEKYNIGAMFLNPSNRLINSRKTRHLNRKNIRLQQKEDPVDAMLLIIYYNYGHIRGKFKKRFGTAGLL